MFYIYYVTMSLTTILYASQPERKQIKTAKREGFTSFYGKRSNVVLD